MQCKNLGEVTETTTTSLHQNQKLKQDEEESGDSR
jgi:hypothetical protein